MIGLGKRLALFFGNKIKGDAGADDGCGPKWNRGEVDFTKLTGADCVESTVADGTGVEALDSETDAFDTTFCATF